MFAASISTTRVPPNYFIVTQAAVHYEYLLLDPDKANQVRVLARYRPNL